MWKPLINEDFSFIGKCFWLFFKSSDFFATLMYIRYNRKLVKATFRDLGDWSKVSFSNKFECFDDWKLSQDVSAALTYPNIQMIFFHKRNSENNFLLLYLFLTRFSGRCFLKYVKNFMTSTQTGLKTWDQFLSRVVLFLGKVESTQTKTNNDFKYVSISFQISVSVSGIFQFPSNIKLKLWTHITVNVWTRPLH